MTYVKNAWHVAGFEMDLKPSAPRAVTINGEPIVVFRTESGRVVAVEDRCIHRLAPLSLGRCEGESIRCMYHGLLFDAEGKCIEIPGQELIPAKAKLRVYPVLVRHSYVWIWMGDPERADEGCIPACVGCDDSEWLVDHHNFEFGANAQLITDNTLDFSHITYLHATSFQIGPNYAFEMPTVIEVDRGVRLTRWTLDSPGATLADKNAEKVGKTGSIDPTIGDTLMDYFFSYCSPSAPLAQI